MSSGTSRSFSTDGGRRLDDVAELRVVADLQAGDAVALRVVELQRRQHAAAVVAQRAFGVQFGVEAGRMAFAVVEPMRRRVGQRVGQPLLERGVDMQDPARRMQCRRKIAVGRFRRPIIMAGPVPAIRRGTALAGMAWTSPAMTMCSAAAAALPAAARRAAPRGRAGRRD